MKKNETERNLSEITVLIVLMLSQYTISATADINARALCDPAAICIDVYLEDAPSPSGGEFYKLKLNNQTKFTDVFVGLWVRGSPTMYQAFVRENDDLDDVFLTNSYFSERDSLNSWNFNLSALTPNYKLNQRKGFWSYIVIRIITVHSINNNMKYFQVYRSANKQEWLGGGGLLPFNSVSDRRNNVLEKCLGLQDFVNGGTIPDDGSGNYFMSLIANSECSYSQMTIVGVHINSQEW